MSLAESGRDNNTAADSSELVRVAVNGCCQNDGRLAPSNGSALRRFWLMAMARSSAPDRVRGVGGRRGKSHACVWHRGPLTESESARGLLPLDADHNPGVGRQGAVAGGELVT